MDLSRTVRLVSTDGHRVAYSPLTLTMAEPEHLPASGPLRRSIVRTRQWLLGEQADDGSWCAELEGDTILESEYILLLAFLNRHDSEIALKCARHLLEKQNADGGWSQYPDGKLDVSISVKAYFALKLTGHDPSSSEPLQRARKRDSGPWRRRFGKQLHTFLPGAPRDRFLTPSVRPCRLRRCCSPKWFPINLYRDKRLERARSSCRCRSCRPAQADVTKLDPRFGISRVVPKTHPCRRGRRCRVAPARKLAQDS